MSKRPSGKQELLLLWAREDTQRPCQCTCPATHSWPASSKSSSSAAHMRSSVTIASLGLEVPDSQHDAPSRCVLHITATCLCKFQRLGIAH